MEMDTLVLQVTEEEYDFLEQDIQKPAKRSRNYDVQMEVGKVEVVEKVESDAVKKREKMCALEKLKGTGEVETTEEKADAVEKLKETGEVETTE